MVLAMVEVQAQAKVTGLEDSEYYRTNYRRQMMTYGGLSCLCANPQKLSMHQHPKRLHYQAVSPVWEEEVL